MPIPGNGYKYTAHRALAKQNIANKTRRNRNHGAVGPSPLRRQVTMRTNRANRNNPRNLFANDPRLSHYTRNFLKRLRSELKPGEPIDPGFYAFVKRAVNADLANNNSAIQWNTFNNSNK